MHDEVIDMKRIVSIITAFVTALSLGSCLVSAEDLSAADAAAFEEVKIQCAPGQTLHLPIYISADNDFESAQFKLIYGRDEKGVPDKTNLSVKKVVSANKDVAVTWHDFKGEGYGNILMYRIGTQNVKDGVIATAEVDIDPDSAVKSHELRLSPVLFATVNGGERKTNDASMVITCDRVLGDSNDDGTVNVRDAAKLCVLLSRGAILPIWADYNGDGTVNVRDCAAIAKDCAKHIIR